MYLKTLEIHGFKSFADRTIFEFAEGVTGIVGPNGCGKSNVVDAIRWVLGETSAKALRGGEMADVIFNGTEKRKPLGMAEVTLTMADCEEALKVDFNEVAITRRVYRDGRSEYRINNTPCRLKDINDMLMDTGIGRTAYSIMAQGQIDQILSSKPEERRAVFEEAAGITKFKKEKKEALRKLEYTEANLLRVSDVLAEQERRMASLKRQVAKARRYQALAADTKVLDTHLSHRRFTELSAARDELTVSMRGLAATEAELTALLPAREADVARTRAEATALEGALAELRQQRNDLLNSLNTAEGRIAFNKERTGELRNRIRHNEEEIADTKGKLAQQEFDFQAAGESLEQLNRILAEKEESLAKQERTAAEAREARDRTESSLRETRTAANLTQTLVAALSAKIESAVSQLEGTRTRSRQLADEEQRLAVELEEFRSEQSRIGTEVEDTRQGLASLEEAFGNSERSWQHIRGDLDAARGAAEESHRTLAQRAARLGAVRQLIDAGEGFEKGTRNLLAGLDQPDRFKPLLHGALASLIEVDNTSARAIETALGSHLHAVLVEDTEAASAVIERLTSAKLGTAAILPGDLAPAARGTQMEALPDGAVAWALDRVRADRRVAGVMERLLDKVLIVPDMATALRLRRQFAGIHFATLAGEWVGAEGVIRGGAAGDAGTSVLELRNEARKLATEVESLEGSDQTLRAKVADLASRLEQAHADLETSRERLQRQKVALSTRQGEFSLAKREVENFESKLEHLRWERGELEARERSAAEGRESMESELVAARDRLASLEEETAKLRAVAAEALHQEEQRNAGLQELRTELAVERRAKLAAEEQQKPMEARLTELRETSARREREIADFLARIEAADTENSTLGADCVSLREQADTLETEIADRASGRAELIARIEDAESRLATVRRDLAKTAEQRGREEIESTKLELRIGNLADTVRERYQTELASFEPDAHALLSSIASQKALQARSGRQTTVAADPEDGDNSDDEAPTIVVDGTEEEAPVPTGDIDGEPDWSFVETIVADIRRRLDAMGPVNLDAIEEFEELEERHTFLRGQHDDLAASRTELLAVIERINEETRRLFSETFAQVRLNFQAMFRELFGEKSQADLTLLDDGDPLESGIEVIAKPPGKKLGSISLLSGGERSMTAVALLFSIYMIKPSPFCVLDELDAPLDESNIGRFIRVLDRFIDHSQFIIVTHSKRTMARADVMYGVTMEEFGVSKPVGMRLTSGTKDTKATGAAANAALRLDA